MRPTPPTYLRHVVDGYVHYVPGDVLDLRMRRGNELSSSSGAPRPSLLAEALEALGSLGELGGIGPVLFLWPRRPRDARPVRAESGTPAQNGVAIVLKEQISSQGLKQGLKQGL